MMRSLLVAALSAPLCALGALAGAWLAVPGEPAPAEAAPGEIVELPTIAAPVFRDGRVQGYFLARVALELGDRHGALAAVPPRIVLADAVIGYVFANPGLRLDGDEPFDRDGFRDELTAVARERLGEVRALYVTQVDFLSKDEIRRGPRARSAELPG